MKPKSQINTQDIPHPNAGHTSPSTPETPPGAEDTPEQNSLKQNQLNEIHPSIYHWEAFEGLKKQIEYDYFEENFPDRIGFIDSLLGYMLELCQENRPDIPRLLDNVDSTVILEFLEEMKGKNFFGVRNIGAYIKKSFAEFLREREVLMATLG